MNDPVFWQLGIVVVQEAVVMTIVLMTGYLILRGTLHALNRLSNRHQPLVLRRPARTPTRAEEVAVLQS